MCVLFKPKPKPPPYFSASYHPNHTDFPLFRKVPVCTADIIARCVLRRRQRLNHTRFWQPLMEMLEGEKKKEKEKASVWLPDYMLHMALQPLLWTLADESSLLCLRTLPRLHWVYSGCCTFFFSSTAKPAIFCSFSMPSLLPASTTPTLTPAAHWSMPSLKCCVQSSPQLMLRVSCCTLVERKYPPFHVCEVFFFLSARSQLLWSAYCSENTSKELFWSALLLQFWSHVSVRSLDPCD